MTGSDALLRSAISDLHRWDVSKGWDSFNAILARIDAALDATKPEFDLDREMAVAHDRLRVSASVREGGER